jgi:hypothetical protein
MVSDIVCQLLPGAGALAVKGTAAPQETAYLRDRCQSSLARRTDEKRHEATRLFVDNLRAVEKVLVR